MNFEISFLAGQPAWVQSLAGLALLIGLAYLARTVAKTVLLKGVAPIAASTQLRVFRVLLNNTVLARLAKIVPSLIIQMLVVTIPHLAIDVATVIRNLAMAVTVLHGVLVLMAILDGVQDQYEKDSARTTGRKRSIKSYIQLGKLGLALVATVIIIATLMDRSPLLLLSGLGAMSAVLLLVFKDTLLSFIAGLQLSSNDLLRVGDWIEMPQLGANGDVIDIALHTVKVQNWDKTITTIPTWRLVSESFINWRGMQESGGRRIKRTLRLDGDSVRFLTPADIERLRHIALLRPYMDDKVDELEHANLLRAQRLGDLSSEPANQRRLTNLGTFRAYASVYLEQHPGIHHGMTRMVRAMEPSSEGIPLELYCFASTTAWVDYEGIQSDVFDHLLAILPEFDLRLFQKPTGYDIASGLQPRAIDTSSTDYNERHRKTAGVKG